MNSITAPVSAELKKFTRVEKLFVFFSMLTGFFISAEYASTRPSSSAIFLSVFSYQTIPWVWLVSVPINLFIVCLYNRYLSKVGPVRMIGIIGMIVAVLHVFCAFVLNIMPKLIFVQFICKDIYILLMFKQLWSMIHSTISVTRAKYLYGCIFGVGTLGAVIGSLIPSLCAVGFGSELLFLTTIPFNLIIYLCYSQAFKRSSLNHSSFVNDLTLNAHPREGFALIRRSPVLITILCLVVLMQSAVGVMDYLFNAHIEISIPDKDLRTEYVGYMVGLTNLLSIFFQLLGGFLMIRVFGVRGSHLLVPLILLCNAFTCWIVPSFTIISISYILIKSVDFSLFGIIREMLYIPMKLDEKFRAKAIIDVFAYRSSKALVSICILVFQVLIGTEVLHFLSIIPTIIFCAWIGVVIYLFRKVPQPV